MQDTSFQSAFENPLSWLRQRKDRNGNHLISAAEFLAGERLRSDMTFSGMLPRVTMDWSRQAPLGAAGHSGGLNPTEAAMAARKRVDLALRALGPEFSGLLMDLCGFGKGLERIEMERQWPARSAKVIARLALAALARHYGINEAAKGPERGHMVRWQDADAKPTMMRPASHASRINDRHP